MGPELILTPCTNPLLEQLHHNNSMCGCDDLENPMVFSERFTSFGSVERSNVRVSSYSKSSTTKDRQQPSKSSPLLDTVTIPVKEIMIVNADKNTAGNNSNHRIHITTIHSGLFECTMENTNGELILMAFLRANLPKDKVVEDGISGYGRLPRSPSNTTQSTNSTNKSFDVEAFTASRMAERLQSESITEKVQRRIYRLVTSLEESKRSTFCWKYN
jgi:hypothetical protein